MSSGLLALLDDITLLARAAAASIDDAAAQAVKAGTKSAGVVIDDTAVTPSYVTGLAAERELPIVARIAKGSIVNKLVFLLPAALALSAFAPWLIQPLLLFGGMFLAFEGAEKVHHWIRPAAHHPVDTDLSAAPETPEELRAFEERKVASAVKTDFILSAEIMAITLSQLPLDMSLFSRAVALALVAVAITVGVYGAVALIVRADDAGVALARARRAWVARFGRGLVAVMPGFLSTLSVVGTVAMLWVGGGILIHSLEVFGLAGPAHLLHDAAHTVETASPVLPAVLGWAVSALGAALVGLGVGLVLMPVVEKVIFPAWQRLRPGRG